MKSFYLFLSVFAACVPLIAATDAKPLNILVLYADDWRHDTLGVAGHPIVQTPHLDRLAAEGVRFTRNAVTTSICGVSRATLFTGQWMSRHGNPAFEMFKTPWAETYPGLLRAHGFYTGHIGKWHNGKFPADNFDFGRSYAGVHWIKNADGTQIHVTQKNENDALEFLRTRPAGKPFVLTLAFFATHAEDRNPLQFLPQPGSLELYKDSVIPPPATGGDDFFKRLPPFIANDQNEGRNRWRWRFDTPEKYQTMMKNYYRLATEVDRTCGRMIDELRKQGALENTLVIFSSDNGPHNESKHDLERFDPNGPYTGIKRSLTDGGIRVPFIAWWPGKVKPGESKHVGYFPDFMPTAAELAGAPAPKKTDGISLVPALTGNEQPQHEFLYWEFHEGGFKQAALYQGRWKGIRSGGPDAPVQLFDLENDVAELTNVADKQPDIATKISDYLKTARTPLAEWEPQWKAGKKSKK